MACGGNVWAEGQAARRDPAGVLARLADDPRLALSAAEKEYLKRAAGRIEAGSRQKQEMIHVPAAARAEHGAAGEMQAMAAELDRLTAPGQEKARPDRSATLAAVFVAFAAVLAAVAFALAGALAAAAFTFAVALEAAFAGALALGALAAATFLPDLPGASPFAGIARSTSLSPPREKRRTVPALVSTSGSESSQLPTFSLARAAPDAELLPVPQGVQEAFALHLTLRAHSPRRPGGAPTLREKDLGVDFEAPRLRLPAENLLNNSHKPPPRLQEGNSSGVILPV